MTKFNVGDRVYIDKPENYSTVIEVDELSHPLPMFKLKNEFGEFLEYTFGWKKVILDDDALRYGEVLTDDMIFGKPKGKSVLDIDWIRIRTVLYESRIFYHKMVNGEVVEFKELTV